MYLSCLCHDPACVILLNVENDTYVVWSAPVSCPQKTLGCSKSWLKKKYANIMLNISPAVAEMQPKCQCMWGITSYGHTLEHGGCKIICHGNITNPRPMQLEYLIMTIKHVTLSCSYSMLSDAHPWLDVVWGIAFATAPHFYIINCMTLLQCPSATVMHHASVKQFIPLSSSFLYYKLYDLVAMPFTHCNASVKQFIPLPGSKCFLSIPRQGLASA